MINPTQHLEIARQRQADFRRAAQARRDLPTVATMTPVFAAVEGLGFLSRCRLNPDS